MNVRGHCGRQALKKLLATVKDGTSQILAVPFSTVARAAAVASGGTATKAVPIGLLVLHGIKMPMRPDPARPTG